MSWHAHLLSLYDNTGIKVQTDDIYLISSNIYLKKHDFFFVFLVVKQITKLVIVRQIISYQYTLIQMKVFYFICVC